MVKGYHQILVAPKDVSKTAAVTPFGLFEFLHMPFGLKNAAQTFQRLMDRVVQDLEGVFVYLDDVLIASKSTQEHQTHLTALLQVLKRHSLVVHLEKCLFGLSQIEFLGHVVSGEGVQPLKGKVQAILDYERQMAVKGLQRFLGMFNFCHRFVKNTAWIVLPLTGSLWGKPRTLTWTKDMFHGFQVGKGSASPVHLASPSGPQIPPPVGYGCELPGIGRGGPTDRRRGPAAASVFLPTYERRWKAGTALIDLELLSIYCSLVHFRHLLEGKTFSILTGQKPLTSAFMKGKDPISSRQQNQLAFISEFCTDIAHVPGLDNVVVDSLSRQHQAGQIPTGSMIAPATHRRPDESLATQQRPDESPATHRWRPQHVMDNSWWHEASCHLSQSCQEAWTGRCRDILEGRCGDIVYSAHIHDRIVTL